MKYICIMICKYYIYISTNIHSIYVYIYMIIYDMLYTFAWMSFTQNCMGHATKTWIVAAHVEFTMKVGSFIHVDE